MNKKLLRSALLLSALSVILFTACNKEDITLQPNNPQTIKSLFADLRSTPQIFAVEAGTNQTITGQQGTRISFHPQSFKNAAGDIITGGTIKIELIEMYKPGDMIANRVTTTTAAQMMLTSGGSVNIKATLSDREVFATTYGIAFKQPAASENPMALFKGYPITDSSGTNIKWYDDTSGTVNRTTKIDTLASFFYLFDSCNSFNWINCDYFYSAPAPKTDITVTMPDNSYTMANTQVFVIFKDINSVSTMYAYNTASHAFSFGYPSYHLPVGAHVDILIMGSKNNAYFADLHSNVVLTQNMSITAAPATQSLANIVSLLSGL